MFTLVLLPCFDLCKSNSFHVKILISLVLGIVGGLITLVLSWMLNSNVPIYHLS